MIQPITLKKVFFIHNKVNLLGCDEIECRSCMRLSFIFLPSYFHSNMFSTHELKLLNSALLEILASKKNDGLRTSP